MSYLGSQYSYTGNISEALGSIWYWRFIMQAAENLHILPENSPFLKSSLLDEQGREIPITEEMIAQACKELLTRYQFPIKKVLA